MTTQTFKVSRQYPSHQFQNWITQTEELISALPDDNPDNVVYWGAKGDGVTNDTAAVQAAFDAGVGEVIFPPGTYLITSSISVPSNTCVYGPGTARFVVGGSGFIVSGRTNVCFENLTVELDLPDGFAGSYPDINCIYVSSSNHVTVSHCKLYHLNGITNCFGIQFLNSTECIVTGSFMEITDPAYDPAAVQNPAFQQGGAMINAGCTDINISDNDITRTGVGLQCQPVSAGDSSDCIFDGNNIHQVGHYGIMLYRLNGEIYRFSITSNTVRDVYGTFFNTAVGGLSHGAGIYLQNPINVTVDGNCVYNACIQTDNESLAPAAIGCLGGAGLPQSQNVISNNVIDLCGRYGIIADGLDVLVTGNTITNCVRSLIYIRRLTRGVISNNVCKNVTTIAVGVGGVVFLGASPSSNITIMGNSFMDMYYGVLVQNASNVVVSGNINNVSSAIVAAGQGITTDAASSSVTITDNVINRNGSFGIRGLGTFNLVRDNRIIGATPGQSLIVSGLNSFVGTNFIDVPNGADSNGRFTIAEANVITPAYLFEPATWITITGIGATPVQTLNTPTRCRASSLIQITGDAGVVLAHNVGATPRLFNLSGADIVVVAGTFYSYRYDVAGGIYYQYA